MKKMVYVSVLFGLVALLVLLAAGPAAAASPQQIGRPWGGGEREPGGGGGGAPGGGGEAGAWGGAGSQGVAEAEPGGTALRINFDVAGHKAHNGLYVVRYPEGDVLATWSAHNGATDSGWINVELTRKTVWVEVVYYPGPHAAPTVMRIMNPAPGTAYGWVSQGVTHAIEVAWPDMPVMPADSVPMMPGGTPWPASPYGMAQGSYGMMASPYGMMGGPGGMMGGPGSMPGGPGGMPGGPGGMPGGPGG